MSSRQAEHLFDFNDIGLLEQLPWLILIIYI